MDNSNNFHVRSIRGNQISNKIATLVIAITGKLFRAILLTSLVTSFYIIRVSHFGLETLLKIIEMILVQVDAASIIRTPIPNESISISEPKFTEKELYVMAKKLPRPDMTLEQIKSYFNTSYRQARKIKNEVDNSPDIHRSYTE